MKKITLKSFCIFCGIVVLAGFAGEKFQSVDLIKSDEEDRLRIVRKTWWGLQTEELEIGSGEWKKVNE
jgi:hypothetical protein